MADREQGAIPQGLIEQARARSVDPGKLQLLGKQAAALHATTGKSLSDSVVDVIGKEDLGPEHTRRICEFTNQEAFKNEWEKGGSVRNVEFDGGPADPSAVLKELNDGARADAVRVASDYDDAPIKVASDNRVEDEIFSGYTNSEPHPSEVPPGMPDLQHLRSTIIGAQDHIFDKVAGLECAKERMGLDFAQAVTDEVLRGTSLQKIAQAISSFAQDAPSFREAFGLVDIAFKDRGIQTEPEKVADGRSIPNPDHPLIQAYVGFEKVAYQARVLNRAVDALDEQRREVEGVIKQAALGPVAKAALGTGALGAGIGAIKADPGDRLGGALRGGLVGAGIGAGAAYGGQKVMQSALTRGGVNPQAFTQLSKTKPVAALQEAERVMGPQAVRSAALKSAGGAAAGALGGGLVGSVAGETLSPTRRPY